MNQDKFGKLTKSQFKSIKSLKQKKYRDLSKQFIIEGYKMISEALDNKVKLEMILFREEFQFDTSLPAFKVSAKEMEMLSNMKSPPNEIAVCRYFEPQELNLNKSIVALDGLSDPGNFGTILRLCDWFSIHQIAASPGTVDIYNPKVVQASMGSLFRVNTLTLSLDELFAQSQTKLSSFAADMNGTSIYDLHLNAPFILVMGSESHGIDQRYAELVDHIISIPRYGRAESLNVAVATAVILSEFKRQNG